MLPSRFGQLAFWTPSFSTEDRGRGSFAPLIFSDYYEFRYMNSRELLASPLGFETVSRVQPVLDSVEARLREEEMQTSTFRRKRTSQNLTAGVDRPTDRGLLMPAHTGAALSRVAARPDPRRVWTGHHDDPPSQPEAGHPQIPDDSEPQWDLFGSPYSSACNGVGVVKVSLIIEHTTHYSTRRPGHLSSTGSDRSQTRSAIFARPGTSHARSPRKPPTVSMLVVIM